MKLGDRRADLPSLTTLTTTASGTREFTIRQRRQQALDSATAVVVARDTLGGELAQLGERLVCNQEVTGSSPVFSTSLRSRLENAVSCGWQASEPRQPTN